MITSWKEMPIGVLEQINDISSLHCSDDEKTFMVTALLAGMDYDDFLSLTLDEARDLVSQTGFVHEAPKKVRVRKEYQIGSRTYTLFRDMMGITTAQYIDFQGIVSKTFEDNLAELMAIVLVPKGHKYADGYDVAEVVEELRSHLSVEEALAIADFFTRQSDRSMQRILRRSEAGMWLAKVRAPKEEKELMEALMLEMKLANDALRSGFGYRWWKQWPR